MLDQTHIDFYTEAPEVVSALQAVEIALSKRGIAAGFHHLLLLRASQINGCGYCVKMHVADARKAGEAQERLDEVVIYAESDAFSPAEKAALAYIEAITHLERGGDFSALRQTLRAHYSDADIASLTIMGGMINLWNRLQIATHG